MSTDNLAPLLSETARAWKTVLDKRLRPLGLSQAKWTVLLLLGRHGDGLTQKQLSERLSVEGPSLVGTLDRLEADGWVERRVSARDRRAKTVHRTDKAVTLTREIEQTAARLRSELFAGIPTEEIEQTVALLTRIKQRIDQIS